MTHYPDFKMVAEQLVQTARWASRMGWAPATSTNYSVRLPDDAAPAYCAITSSGVDKGTIEVEHILAVDQHGRPIDADRLKPSAETPSICCSIARWEPEPCIHTHSLPAALLSQLARDEGRILLSGWELLKGLSGIDTHEVEISLPVFPNSQDMQALSTRVERSLRGSGPVMDFCWQDMASMRGARISPRPNDISRSSNIFSNANER